MRMGDIESYPLSGMSPRRMAGMIRRAGCGASHFIKNAARLFRTPQHVVDQGSIDIRAPDANGIEQRFVVGHEIPLIDQILGKDLFVAYVTQHHEPA